MIALLIGVADPQLKAIKHPVMLDANAGASKCIECHADLTKGKTVHAATVKGCLACHEVRVGKDVTHVKLITSTPAALCLAATKTRIPPTSPARSTLRRFAIA